MASEDIYFLGFIFSAFVLSAGGIAYYHLTGKAQWAEKDKKMTLGCLASCVIAVPALIVIFSGIHFAQTQLLPRLPPALPTEVKALVQIMVFVACGCLAWWIDNLLAKRWAFWFGLHQVVNRGEKAHQDRKRPEWIEKLGRIFSNDK